MGKCLPRFLSISLLILLSALGLLLFGVHQDKPESLPGSPGTLVVKVIDGDTIEIEGGQKVRYLGVDTPETKDPRKPVQCFGKEAGNKNRTLVEGKRVILEKDISDADKYGRLLRYAYLPLPDGSLLFVNDFLIREGFAKVLTIPPDVKYAEQFLEAQRNAREAKLGLWKMC